MDFFGIGWGELLAILVIVLLVAGPRDIARIARNLGRFLNRLYRSPSYQAVRRASTELRNLPQRLAREAELEELEAMKKELEEATRLAQEETARAAREALEPAKLPPPTETPAATSTNGAPAARVNPARRTSTGISERTRPAATPANKTPAAPPTADASASTENRIGGEPQPFQAWVEELPPAPAAPDEPPAPKA